LPFHLRCSASGSARNHTYRGTQGESKLPPRNTPITSGIDSRSSRVSYIQNWNERFILAPKEGFVASEDGSQEPCGDDGRATPGEWRRSRPPDLSGPVPSSTFSLAAVYCRSPLLREPSGNSLVRFSLRNQYVTFSLLHVDVATSSPV
jgi:hypothetical protein